MGGMEVKHHIFWKWMKVAFCLHITAASSLRKEPTEPLNRF
jgi:hypothetical protein